MGWRWKCGEAIPRPLSPTPASAVRRVYIHGAGVAGFILITRLTSSAQAPVLAALVVASWGVRSKTYSAFGRSIPSA
jgi:hypothetical protein